MASDRELIWSALRSYGRAENRHGQGQGSIEEIFALRGAVRAGIDDVLDRLAIERDAALARAERAEAAWRRLACHARAIEDGSIEELRETFRALTDADKDGPDAGEGGA